MHALIEWTKTACGWAAKYYKLDGECKSYNKATNSHGLTSDLQKKSKKKCLHRLRQSRDGDVGRRGCDTEVDGSKTESISPQEEVQIGASAMIVCVAPNKSGSVWDQNSLVWSI